MKEQHPLESATNTIDQGIEVMIKAGETIANLSRQNRILLAGYDQILNLLQERGDLALQPILDIIRDTMGKFKQ